MRILQRNPRWKARFPVPVDWAFLGHLSNGVPLESDQKSVALSNEDKIAWFFFRWGNLRISL